MDIQELVRQAEEHKNRLASDVELASSRIEHVRVVARYHEASEIYDGLYEMLLAAERAQAS